MKTLIKSLTEKTLECMKKQAFYADKANNAKSTIEKKAFSIRAFQAISDVIFLKSRINKLLGK